MVINHNLKRLFMLAILLVGLLLSGCAKPQQAGLIIAGSTSVQPFAEALVELYTHQGNKTIIDIQGGGSSAGIKSAQTNTADIGMSSRKLKDPEKTLWSVEIAKDGLALIVHPDNQVADLSLEQIRKIYDGTFTNWSEVGGRDAKIHVIAREEGSGTRSAFETLVMDEHEIDPRSIIQDSNGTVRQLVGDDPNAIGFISLGLVNDQVKALMIDGVAATHDNVLNGSYQLTRPFLFVVNGEPQGEVKAFIDFVLSDEAKALLDREGLITFSDGGK
jgi:phosphate transport system substrate-binding protein